jgi:drug/metabolite transporter (DMT)-like permease
LCFSLGNIVSARMQRNDIRVVPASGYGMAYGALFMLGLTLATGQPFAFDTRPEYLISLIYLILIASVAGFGVYLTLVGRIGAGSAAYATVLFPVVALAISTLFEDYRWTAVSLLGLALVLAGNVIVLRR